MQQSSMDDGPNLIEEQLATQMELLAKAQGQTAVKLVEMHAKKMEEKWEGQLKWLEKDKEEREKQMDVRMAHLEEEQANLQGQVDQLDQEKDGLEKLVGKLMEIQAKQQDRLNHLEMQDGTLTKQVEKRARKMEKLGEKQAAEYARLIGVPNVANLQEHYKRKKLLQLIEHGNAIIYRIYVQYNQDLFDRELLQSIVDLLASTDKPEKLLGEVTIECGDLSFTWPQNEKLQLKRKMSNVAIKFNEASTSPATRSGYLVEYELAKKDCCFQVLFYYGHEEDLNKCVWKFICRRCLA